FSFHSIPTRYFVSGDPYYCFCQGTARAVAERLGLAAGEWSVAFQSRFGREEWLKPYVDVLLKEYARSGPKRLTVVCPGFATDCLETLEEINMQDRELFRANGGESFEYVPCLNASEAHIGALEQVVLAHTRGWAPFEGPADPATLAAARDRARAMGASN
ncbi:MAG TPA: ferrochelatase, partial [Steroidobacteraceae bacterium]|nr:ferrochelatase [Steroidobacteraceae bacterium]